MRPGFKWGLAGLVTVAVFAVVTWLVTDFAAPLWVHADGAQLAWGLGAGTAAAALAALWGNTYATPEPERPAAEGGQVVENSVIWGGGITQVSGAGSVKITHRGATPHPLQAPPAPLGGTPYADPPGGGAQRVSGTTVAGPLDQVQGVNGEVEIEQRLGGQLVAAAPTSGPAARLPWAAQERSTGTSCCSAQRTTCSR